MTKALVASLCIAVVASLCAAIAVLSPGRALGQSPGANETTPESKEAWPPPAAPKPATATPPVLALPPPEVLLVLIRTTLVALNQAVQTGNFTVLHDLGSPDFQTANSPAQLGIVFADLHNRNIDLSPVVVVTPEVSEPPAFTPGGMLRLVGYFPTRPLEVKFQMLFQPVNGQWRMFGMSVDAAPPLGSRGSYD